MSDRGIMKELDLGRFGSAGMANVADAVAKEHSEMAVSYNFISTATTNAVQEVTVLQDDCCAGRVKAVKIIAPAAWTASDLNYLTFTVSKRTANGAATVVATANGQTTGIGNVTAFLPFALAITANATDYAVGDQLTFKALQTGNGAVLGLANCNPLLSILIERI